jgi:hypothetical protein
MQQIRENNQNNGLYRDLSENLSQNAELLMQQLP